jgi:steroid delta-isomerase-like uncharacterized protein
MSADNKAIVRRLIKEVWNRRDVNVLDDIVSANYVGHDPAFSHPDGTVGFKEGVKSIRSALPDIEFAIEDLIADGDTVVFRWSGRGSHQGVFLGVTPTGRQVNITGINIIRVSGGKITEQWSNWDTLGLLRQLGGELAATQGKS